SLAIKYVVVKGKKQDIALGQKGSCFPDWSILRQINGMAVTLYRRYQKETIRAITIIIYAFKVDCSLIRSIHISP
ncbi:MAG: hypothetical protein WAM14_11525, partial [Candidatus Nitrosopolaris sp.]